MAPHANKSTNRARVSEKLRRVWNVQEKLAVIMYHEKGYSVIVEYSGHFIFIFILLYYIFIYSYSYF